MKADIDEFFHLPHIVRPGETISSASLSRGAGGKGANQAYACAKAGGNVVLEGHIGSDGLWVRDLLEQGGVKVDRVEVLKDEVSCFLGLCDTGVLCSPCRPVCSRTNCLQTSANYTR